jgi:SnoaL-like domain
MTGDEFAGLLNEFTLSAESGDGARFASHFTEDAIYYDYIYGAHKGRADIAHMMQHLFHRDAADYRWEMFDPVFDGICLVAVEFHFEDRAVQRPARRDRRHEPLHRARRPGRRIPRIRQRRRRDDAARRCAGPDD